MNCQLRPLQSHASGRADSDGGLRVSIEIPVLQEAAAQLIERKDRKAYRAAAALLSEARTFADRCGQQLSFRHYVIRLRADHKTKPALRDELDKAGLPG